MPVDDTAAAVIGTKLDLLKEDIGRRLDDHRDDIRSMRAEMATNYVHQGAYQAEYGRMSDRIGNVEADVVELRTSLATQFLDTHGHIDRRFNEIVEKVHEERLSRRWVIGLVVSVVLGLLASATAVAIAVISGH
jgi:hypothetical protein